MSETTIEILLIEDNLFDAEMTIRALKKNKISNNITHIINGALALDFIFGKGQYEGRGITKPKLILLDIKMPKLNGLEVLAKLKADDETRDIPVVILTSTNNHKDIATFNALGVLSYIPKPVEFEDFLKVTAGLGIFL